MFQLPLFFLIHPFSLWFTHSWALHLGYEALKHVFQWKSVSFSLLTIKDFSEPPEPCHRLVLNQFDYQGCELLTDLIPWFPLRDQHEHWVYHGVSEPEGSCSKAVHDVRLHPWIILAKLVHQESIPVESRCMDCLLQLGRVFCQLFVLFSLVAQHITYMRFCEYLKMCDVNTT